MTKLQKIKRALISVSDKTGIVDLAKLLQDRDVEIISTGGTSKLLSENNINVKDISEFTGFPEIMDGRVKTLHPKVHGALLGVLDNENHMSQAAENNIDSVDLTIINLYPFVQTVNSGAQYDDVIENIDIGGPSMIRSTAKNHLYKTVITDCDDYAGLLSQLDENNGSTTLEFRKKMACKAFTNTANYDQAISSYFNNYLNNDFSHKFVAPASLKQKLRYGENSHQSAAVYKLDLSKGGIVDAKQLQGKELSYNNFNDSDAAYNLILEFDKPACAIIKHANPCGVGVGSDIKDAFVRALEADSKSAFGGIVSLNKEVNKELAEEISKIFFEVIIAPKFSDDAIEILSKRKNLRLLEVNLEYRENNQFKSVSGGILVQENDNKVLKAADLKQVSKNKVTDTEMEELLFAISVCKHVKSNAIVLTNDLQTVGIGAGQTSRVDSVEIACKKAQNFNNVDGSISDKAKSAVIASDAFFPFADGLEFAIKSGVKAAIAPGGSVRDQEVIEAADKAGISLYFIESRHFKH